MSESDGALGDDSSSEVLERGSLHLVVTEVVSVGGGAEQNKNKQKKFSRLICEGLRRVWTELRSCESRGGRPGFPSWT